MSTGDIDRHYSTAECSGYEDGYKESNDLAAMKAAFRDWCMEQCEDVHRRRAKAGD